MLPKFDSGMTYVTIEMESGTKLDGTKAAVAKIEDYLSKKSMYQTMMYK